MIVDLVSVPAIEKYLAHPQVVPSSSRKSVVREPLSDDVRSQRIFKFTSRSLDSPEIVIRGRDRRTYLRMLMKAFAAIYCCHEVLFRLVDIGEEVR